MTKQIRQYDFSVIRGCTLQSGKMFSINETVPSGTTLADIIKGLEDGVYTLKSLANKTYRGDIRKRVDTETLGSFVFDKAEDKLSFKVPASVTALWDNVDDVLFYDIFETDSTTGDVILLLRGKIVVSAAITQES